MIKFTSINSFPNVWITSDTHYSHKNICRGTTTWELKDHGGSNSVRDFETVEEMNQALIDGINNVVGYEDLLIHAGDWSFGGKSQITEFWGKIKTPNIILCSGNHDHNIRDKEYETYFDLVVPVNDIQYLQRKGVRFVVSHYPMLVWHQSHKGSPLAFGHVHGSLEGVGKSQDVGVDVAFREFGEYRPFNITEFFEIIEKKEISYGSHHNKKTS